VALIVLLVVARGGRTRRLGWVALGGAIASSVWMALLFQSAQDPSGSISGPTPTQEAFSWAPPWPSPPPWSRTAAVRIRPASCWASGTGRLPRARDPHGHPQPVRHLHLPGGIQLATVLSAVVILVVTHPAIRGAPILATPVLQWIGKRSYAIYLWHWPIFQ